MKCALLTGTAIALFYCAPAQATETITYKYDAKGRLVEVKRTGTVNNNVTTTYQHDKADNRKNLTTTGSPNAPPP
jgi:phage gp36-like protein